MSEKLKRDGINDGTKAKSTLQLRAIDFLKDYGDKKTLESYARLLCWDLNLSYRTALDSYIMPLFERNYFIYEGDNKYSFKNGKEKNRKTKPEEKEESLKEYAERREKEKQEEKKENKNEKQN